MGFNVQVKRPLPFAPATRIVSLCPADVLGPAWNAHMRSAAGRGKPIYFIGSGKTAMDCIYHLCKHEGAGRLYQDRIHCIAGRGMQVRESYTIYYSCCSASTHMYAEK